MTKEIINIKSRDQWLKERVKDVTSTEVSALYGLSPYLSEFELFHQKRDQVIVNLAGNERMTWGTRLEPIIASGVAEDMGWNIEKLDVYMRDPDVRIGSSFDYLIKSSENGPGILECKNVDWLQYRQKWIDDGAGNIEAPEHIELQVQHQMEIFDCNWAAIGVLVGGNEKKVVLRNRDKGIGADIRAKVQEFWQKVEANRPPSPDYSMDAEFIIKQLRNHANPDEMIEADEELENIIREYDWLTQQSKQFADSKDRVKAKILERIGSASKVVTSFGNLSCGMTKGSKGTLITPEMVGTYIGSRDGFRNFRFNARKGE